MNLESMDTQNKAVVKPPCKHTIHWFRKSLRIHDNPSLQAGIEDATTFRCIFIVDPWFAKASNVGINKWRFLLECLVDLDESLKSLDSRLFVIRGQPADVLPKLIREWGTTTLTFEEDPEPYGKIRDRNISAKCRDLGVTVCSRVSHTLYNLDDIIELNGGQAPLTYIQFQSIVARMPPPHPPLPTITKEFLKQAKSPILPNHDMRFGIPTLEELGFDTTSLNPSVWLGGEKEALTRLEQHLERKTIATTQKRCFKPVTEFLFHSKSGLSPYLRFGCLSVTLFYHQLTDLYVKIKKKRPSLSLHGQILWREFFYCAATRNPNFDRMEGNPICVQIPWGKDPTALAKWANGQTGFPWIDAIMNQLRQEGWIHHLARHAVACFLTRGDLWISWEEGMKVFDELLLDADWSVNAGTWMWLSCSTFFQQFFHCYCPVRFGRKLDPNGEYIRYYLPVLKNMPTEYIHKPWVAPESVQKEAGCIIGTNYPLPMVDHKIVSQINLQRIKQIFTRLTKYKFQDNVKHMQPSPIILINLQQKKSDKSIKKKSSNQNDNFNDQLYEKSKQEKNNLSTASTPLTSAQDSIGTSVPITSMTSEFKIPVAKYVSSGHSYSQNSSNSIVSTSACVAQASISGIQNAKTTDIAESHKDDKMNASKNALNKNLNHANEQNAVWLAKNDEAFENFSKNKMSANHNLYITYLNKLQHDNHPNINLESNIPSKHSFNIDKLLCQPSGSKTDFSKMNTLDCSNLYDHTHRNETMNINETDTVNKSNIEIVNYNQDMINFHHAPQSSSNANVDAAIDSTKYQKKYVKYKNMQSEQNLDD